MKRSVRAPSVSPAEELLARRGEIASLRQDEALGDGLRSTAPAHEHWVSSAAVRQAIGAWAYTLGPSTRPGSEGLRAALGVASVIRELALDPVRRQWSAGGGEAVEAAVPADLSQLAARSGLAPRDVARALEILGAARVVTRQTGSTVATVSLSQEVLTPAPAVARLAWTAARDRLHAVGSSVAPALAVLRELASLVGAFDAGAGSASVRASLRDLEDATAFGRSTVSEALSALDRARLVDVETRAGRTTRFILRCAAFGLPDEGPRPHATPERSTGPAAIPSARALPESEALEVPLRVERQSATDHAGSASRHGAAGASALIGTFAGTPIFAPPGTPLILDCDAEGRWTCRVGPLLVLGPVELT